MCWKCRCSDCECEHVASLGVHELEVEITWLRDNMPADRGFDTKAERERSAKRIDNRIDAWALRKDLTAGLEDL